MNTTDHETGVDDLTTPAELSRYLAAEGLMERHGRGPLPRTSSWRSGSGPGCVARWSSTTTGGSEPLPALGEALAELPVSLAWGGDAPACGRPRTAWPGALARVGLAAHQAAPTGIWWRLKICASDECEWAYYDHSKNRSRNWCEYGCGNKLKTRAYRARKAGRPASS